MQRLFQFWNREFQVINHQERVSFKVDVIHGHSMNTPTKGLMSGGSDAWKRSSLVLGNGLLQKRQQLTNNNWRRNIVAAYVGGLSQKLRRIFFQAWHPTSLETWTYTQKNAVRISQTISNPSTDSWLNREEPAPQESIDQFVCRYKLKVTLLKIQMFTF